MMPKMGAMALSIRLRCASWEQLAALYEREIKQGRLFLKASRAPSPGTEMRIDLALPSGTMIPLEARVAHIIPAGQPRGPGVELVLVKVPQSTMWLIESALRKAPPPPALAPSQEDEIPIVVEEPEAAGATDELIAALQAELADFTRMNAFQVLGVGYDAESDAVRNAFTELAKKYHPDRFARLESEQARSLASEIFVLIRQAYRRIADPALRAQATATMRGRAATAPGVPPPRAGGSGAGPVPPPPSPAAPSPAAPSPTPRAGGSGAGPAPSPPSSSPPTPPAAAPSSPSPRPATPAPARQAPRSATLPGVPGAPPPLPVAAAPRPAQRLSASELFDDMDGTGAPAAAPPPVTLAETEASAEGERLLQAGRHDEALAAYEAILRATPGNRVARVGRELARGLKLAAAGDGLTAAPYFETVLEIDPLNEVASRELGAIRRAATDSRKGLLSKLLGRKM
jgi:DnaJ-domain-containing protein 1